MTMLLIIYRFYTGKVESLIEILGIISALTGIYVFWLIDTQNSSSSSIANSKESLFVIGMVVCAVHCYLRSIGLEITHQIQDSFDYSQKILGSNLCSITMCLLFSFSFNFQISITSYQKYDVSIINYLAIVGLATVLMNKFFEILVRSHYLDQHIRSVFLIPLALTASV